MQQWEAVNAKRIIREEGSGEEEEEEGGRQKKWSGIEKEKARYSYKKKWKTRGVTGGHIQKIGSEEWDGEI